MDACITTYTGKQFYPGDPDQNLINILDIAHALALTCRFAGHCRTFYSVAEHTKRLCDIVPIELKPLAVMHDAAEAYLLDVPSPLKDTVFKDYRKVEQNLCSLIFQKFDILPVTEGMLAELKKAENRLVATEIRDLMNNHDENYCLIGKPLPEAIIPVAWYKAEKQFLDVYYRYVVR